MNYHKNQKNEHEMDRPGLTDKVNANNSGNGTASISTPADSDIEALKKNLSEEQAKAEKYLDQWRRTQADFDNYRKRSEQEKNETAQNTICNVIAKILPVVDDLERALASVPPESDNLPWVEGVKLIHKKFKTILESMGIHELCALGQSFDPSLHEAVAQAEGEEGKVINEVQKGYKLKEKLIRPSYVVVGKGFEKTNEEKNN